MKKTFFLWLFIAAAFFANGQGNTLYEVNVVKPKSPVHATRTAQPTADVAQLLIIRRIHDPPQRELFGIIEALDGFRLRLRLRQRRQQHCRQYRDDRNDHQQFN